MLVIGIGGEFDGSDGRGMLGDGSDEIKVVVHVKHVNDTVSGRGSEQSGT